MLWALPESGRELEERANLGVSSSKILRAQWHSADPDRLALLDSQKLRIHALSNGTSEVDMNY